jgi:four helix bundle protein
VGAFEKDYRFRNQIRDAAVSVMSNIAEGFERDGKKEFLQFLSIAKGSAGEVRSQLYVALDIGYIDNNTFHDFYQLTIETSRLLSGFIRYLQSTRHTGLKFRKPSQPEP